MDMTFSVFNCHINNADTRVREMLANEAPKILERVEEIEEEQNGIMGIFNVEPEMATMVYTGAIMAIVNIEEQYKAPKDSYL